MLLDTESSFNLGDVSENPPDLGACCACGTSGPTVRNIVMLDQKAPLPGTGWGCLECDLPPDGAVAVICDDCLATKREITQVVRGYPQDHGRLTRSLLKTGPHRHDEARHAALAAQEEEARHGPGEGTGPAPAH